MKLRDDIRTFEMGKASLRAAGTDKYGVAVAEVPDTHPSEPTIAVVADHVGASQATPVPYYGLAGSCGPFLHLWRP